MEADGGEGEAEEVGAGRRTPLPRGPPPPRPVLEASVSCWPWPRVDLAEEGGVVAAAAELRRGPAMAAEVGSR